MNVYCLALASVAAFLALDAGAFRADDGNRPDTDNQRHGMDATNAGDELRDGDQNDSWRNTMTTADRGRADWWTNEDGDEDEDDDDDDDDETDEIGDADDDKNGDDGLAAMVARKIATLQDIWLADEGGMIENGMDGALAVAKMSVKTSSGREFVTFYDAVVNKLQNGTLERAYVNPERDVVAVGYSFDELEATGAFKSTVRGAESGRFAIVLKNVHGNVSAGFGDRDRSVAAAVRRPMRMQYADSVVRTDGGVETRALDDALERGGYLGALEHAVSAEVWRSTGRGAIGRLADECRRPWTVSAADRPSLDVRWTEGDLSMDAAGCRYRDDPGRAVAGMFGSVSYQRRRRRRWSASGYRARYAFRLNGLRWTCALTTVVRRSNTTATDTAPESDVQIGRLDVRVTVTGGQPPSLKCGKIRARVAARDVRYDLKNGRAATVGDKLGRFVERSLEAAVRRALRRQLCRR